MENTKKQIEEKFEIAVNTARQLLKEIGDMRNIEMSKVNPTEEPEKAEEIVKLARELDERTNYILKGLLIPYGGVLFL